MAVKKQSLPFDNLGGKIVICRRLIDSENYQSLYIYSRALIPLMQTHWRNTKPVDYGIREAMERLKCSKQPAINAFKALEERGFIKLVDEAVFSSRNDCLSRTWRLTWLPFDSKPPTNEWEKWED